MAAEIGEIRAFAIDYAPRGWLECDGREVSRAEPRYAALFSVIGTTYGGNGSPNFNLPDLRGRTLMGAGQGFGLIGRHVGETPGEEAVKLTIDDLPSHQHIARARRVSGGTAGLHSTPQAGDHIGRLFGETSQFGKSYCTKRLFPVDLHAGTVGTGGGGGGHENRQPFLPITYCIAIEM
jgi:microcystin-dependent protein